MPAISTRFFLLILFVSIVSAIDGMSAEMNIGAEGLQKTGAGGIMPDNRPFGGEGSKRSHPSAEIICSKDAVYIGGINKDTLVVVRGATYSYTVDTPEGEGLVTTGISVKELPSQISAKDGSQQQYSIIDLQGSLKTSGDVFTGDRLIVTASDGKTNKKYYIAVRALAVGGRLQVVQKEITVDTPTDLLLYYTAGQRSPDATVSIYLPPGINATLSNTSVNVIGRGDVALNGLASQSVGRVGAGYPYTRVGDVQIIKQAAGGTMLYFTGLDLRPANGADLKIVIRNTSLPREGKYSFRAVYTTSQPQVLTSAGIGAETAALTAVITVSDFARETDRALQYKETPATYTTVRFSWSPANSSGIQLMQSLDKGKSWSRSPATITPKDSAVSISGLRPDKLYTFRLSVKDGRKKGFSNSVYFYSGKMDIKNSGVTGDGKEDDTRKINDAIEYLHGLGGGTLLFSAGIYNVRTVHLKSNVYLYLEKDAVIKALKGADSPEATWFSDKAYRSGLSPTDTGPYEDPDNWLTKQDVGHTFFRNAMFVGERLDNVKIIGNGLITGNGNLVTSDKVMNNKPDNRADKMFSFKLCTNLEIGGIYRDEDLWYDPEKDEPYYIGSNGSKITDLDNMLKIECAGHFVLLATGTDNIHVHNTYFAKYNTSNVRDIYDFMGCRNVTVTNIYSKVSSDDIVKPGSDCSLGFTRPAGHYKVRNIIGDTNCNLFQIGSETADDITDICVDNIYVLGANKAGFSISTNDGGHVKNIHLNCGHTGKLHSRSRMYRVTTPFFISISNRGRVLGARAERYKFREDGKQRDELLVSNVNIGEVENIILYGIDISAVYGGSSFRGGRWPVYDGSRRRATPIIAGYKLPETQAVEGGLRFRLPDGEHTGYIKNVVFNDVHILVKGGNPASDTAQSPPELGVGQYNVSNLKIQPSYGLWARHVIGLTVKNSSFSYEKPDGRYALFFDDVKGATVSRIKMMKAADNDTTIKLKNSSDIHIEDAGILKYDVRM